ncbi:hypothetical protein BRADI_2g19736v3 [Brachypodium distachyon]|uniref:Secreted protein n=1 Tax=Brachypodium distachyon TaxID=15368 RepID=A0A0Q3G1X8_BRADI|nr:hypothetical protein BRADI_2g19736v3 [Brachypodium distachyon]
MALVKKNTHALWFVALRLISSAFLSRPATAAGRDITSRDIDPTGAFGLMCFPLAGCEKAECQRQCTWQGYPEYNSYCNKDNGGSCCCKS